MNGLYQVRLTCARLHPSRQALHHFLALVSRHPLVMRHALSSRLLALNTALPLEELTRFNVA